MQGSYRSGEEDVPGNRDSSKVYTSASMFSAGRETLKACRSTKNIAFHRTFFTPDPRTVTVLFRIEKHRSSIIFSAKSRQKAAPQICAAGIHASRASCGHFTISSARLQLEIAADFQIYKVHRLSPTALSCRPELCITPPLGWRGVVGCTPNHDLLHAPLIGTPL